MSSSNVVYGSISQEIIFYFGIPTLIFGLIGNILNVIVFLSLKTFRESSCAFFLTMMSLVNIGQLSTNLLTRIMITGFNIDWTESSLIFCKIRNYLLQYCALMSYTSMSLATIDQFLATSFHRRWQKCLDLKKAHCLSFVTSIIWFLHGIPTLIFYNLGYSIRQDKIACVITSTLYQRYFSYGYLLLLAGLLPILINIIFGSLAYRNVRQIPYRTVPLVRRELDKQLTKIVLVQILFTTLVVTPYVISILIVNFLASTGQTESLPMWNFANLITGMIYYWHFAGPFYLNLSASKRFRQQFLYVICAKSCREKAIRPIE